MAWWHKAQGVYLSGLSSTYSGIAGLLDKIGLTSLLACFISAICVWLYQAFMWLRTGDWQPMSLLSQFGAFSFSGWTGLERILNFAADLNLGFILLLCGWLLLKLFKILASMFGMSALEVGEHVKQVKRKELGLDD
ncbi:MAG: hypothetical protein V3R53_04025 [Gammaproteobacteria bacterium]|jgi:hypothetical protein